MKKAMKKRQTEYTTAQRCPSPAERGHSGAASLSLWSFRRASAERASPVTENKRARIFARTWVVPRKHYAFVP